VTRVPVHPFLVALSVVLTSYAAIPGASHPSELLRASGVAVAVAAALFLAFGAVYRDRHKAALVVSLLLVVLVAVDSFYPLVENLAIAGWHPGRRRYVLSITYALLVAFGIALYARRQPLAGVTAFANLVSVVALYPVVMLAYAHAPTVLAGAHAAAARLPITATTTAKPDIYYVVLDRYAGEETLRKYGVQNDLTEYLGTRGFFVARESRANYIKTVLSIASSLNLDYLDDLARGRSDSSDFMPIYDHLASHRVGAFLRSQGYRYEHLGSWYWPTRTNRQATRNVNYYDAIPRPVMRHLDSIMLAPVQHAFASPWVDSRRQNWVRVRRQVDDVLRIAGEPGPKFVFLHMLVPHPPNVFDRDGSYLSLDEESRRPWRENYGNQVLAADAMLKRLVDGILRTSSLPPVILLQGDEGPYPQGTESDTYDWRQASLEHLRERSAILNAYYLPGVDPHALDSHLSPVNSFRVVFNTYFGTDLPRMPDRTFGHISDLRPYAFFDITEKVAGDRIARHR